MVTGASSGIGLEFASQLAGRGHNVVLVARREQRLVDLAERLTREHGVRAEVLTCDLADADARARLLEQVAGTGLQIETLVNNAGFPRAGDVHEHPDEQLGMVRVNVEALVALTAAYLPAMVERRRGAIVNVASLAAFMPLPALATYAATKSFVLSFSEALWAETRRSGVSVTALCPGFVPTEFYDVGGFKRTMLGPSFVWASASQVARAGIEGAEGGKRLVVPSKIQRIAGALSRYSPRPLALGPFAALWRWGIGE